VESELVRGSGGIFKVSVDKKPIFSKQDVGRFPTEKEIIEQLQSMKPRA
jgi:selT/selW/selH-like putative selenoprotein